MGVQSVKLIGDAAAPAPIAWATYAGHRYANELDEDDIGDALPFRRKLHSFRGAIDHSPRKRTAVTLTVVLPVIWALRAFIKKIGTDHRCTCRANCTTSGCMRSLFRVLALKRQLFVFAEAGQFFWSPVLAYVVPVAADVGGIKIDAAVLTMIVSLTPVFTVAVAMGLRLIRPALRLILSVIVGTMVSFCYC